MAVKGGQIIHVANDQVLLDRLQTAGPGNVNIPRETVYELGNYRSVAQVSGVPDLSFSLESFDVTPEMEAFLLRKPVGTTHSYDLATAKYVNLKSAFKPGLNAAAPYDVDGSASIPCLRLEQMSYAFGVGTTNARQTATLRGDTLYYSNGSTYIQEVAGSGTAGQTITLDEDAYGLMEGGQLRYTLAITAGEKRLTYGVDYTEAVGTVTAGAASVTITLVDAVAATDVVAVSYHSPAIESFPQSVHALVSGVGTTSTASASIGATSVTVTSSTGFAAGNTIILGTGTAGELAVVSAVPDATHLTLASALVAAHASGTAVSVYAPTTKPAAVRGKDIDVYIGPAHPVGTAPATAIGTWRHGVQSANADWRVTIQNDEEMGNSHYVDSDFDVPQVSGSITFRPRDVAAIMALVNDFGNNSDALTTHRAAGVGDGVTLDLQIAIRNPADGRVLKRIHVPDARFTVPGYQGRVQQKLDLQVQFQSDQGLLYVYDS
jgi:hypothetical protein